MSALIWLLGAIETIAIPTIFLTCALKPKPLRRRFHSRIQQDD